MRFPTPLVEARLLRRYKRFLADMALPCGREITAHCPNPGAMTGLAEAGQTCWIAPSKARAKLDWGWKLTRTHAGAMVVIDTTLANHVVAEALASPLCAALGHTAVRAEVKLDAHSRIDFQLTTPEGVMWLEVKSTTLKRGATAEFPDSRTLRGTKHLQALAAERRGGTRAAMLYLIARDDAQDFAVAKDIDPAYAQALEAATAQGLEVYSLTTAITPEAITPQVFRRLA